MDTLSSRTGYFAFQKKVPFLLILLLAIPACMAQGFDRIVVFGTSLSDSGNYFALTHIDNVPPTFQVDAYLVPDAAYAIGGHHMSNGPTWIEQFARPLGLSWSVKPNFSGARGATDYAVNGARAWTNDNPVNGVDISLSAQVNRFLQAFDGVAPSDALYVVEMGSNDVRDALEAYITGGGASGASEVLGQALNTINEQLGDLYEAGARYFLIVNVPDISVTPAVSILDASIPGDGIAPLASNLAEFFNSQLANIKDGLAAIDTTGYVKLFNAYQKTDAIVADPEEFGLVNVTQACIEPDVAPFMCQDPDGYLFWDGIHPTKAGAAILAQEVADIPGL